MTDTRTDGYSLATTEFQTSEAWYWKDRAPAFLPWRVEQAAAFEAEEERDAESKCEDRRYVWDEKNVAECC